MKNQENRKAGKQEIGNRPSTAPRADRFPAFPFPCFPDFPRSRAQSRSRGLSLIELLISLSITAMLLTATMVAIDASFKAYAAAAETASTQTTTRLVTHRLLTLIRTSTAHGPLVPDAAAEPPVTLDGDTITSNYLELIDVSGNFLHVEYRSASQEIWVSRTPYGQSPQPAQPLLGGVTSCTFYAQRRTDSNGVLVLERASIDLTVEADDDSTLETELGEKHPIRVIASTKPRKIEP